LKKIEIEKTIMEVKYSPTITVQIKITIILTIPEDDDVEDPHVT
jgi:hypothetical protein